MTSDCGKGISVLRVDGGVTNSDLCMQIQANVLEIDVGTTNFQISLIISQERPLMKESTALGAALASALGAGIIAKVEDFVLEHECFVFKADIDVDSANRFKEWKKAVTKSFD